MKEFYLGSSIYAIIKSYYIKLMNMNKSINLIGKNGQINVDKFYTWEEIKKHNHPNNGWIVLTINNVSSVFDITSWIPEHPGGSEILIKHLGIDATNNFESIGHPEYIYNTLLPKYFLGFVKN